MPIIFSLVDCNNFYASCERIFNPNLSNKPIVVLSNNDGCIIARSNEAKKLGIPMGAPYHQTKYLLKKNKVSVFSSNYQLYGDISRRVMSSLSMFVPEMEVYSIDEAFLRLDKHYGKDPYSLASDIQLKVLKWTGIPTSHGIAPTKTLAKVANYGAKKYPATNGVVDVTNQERRRKLMAIMPVREVWGVGSRINKKLNSLGITTALQLSELDTKLIKRKFSSVLERTVMELKGYPCIGLKEQPATKKQIVVSRTFSRKITDLNSMNEAISDYTSRACEKLRGEDQYCKMVSVFMRTNYFRKQDKQYHGFMSYKLHSPTNDTRDVLRATKMLSERVFKKNINFIKAGVMLSDFYDEGVYQGDLFRSMRKRSGSKELMMTVDRINSSGIGKITFAAQGIKKTWSMKRFLQSPRYLTSWEEMPIVK